MPDAFPTLGADLRRALDALDPAAPRFATDAVDRLLAGAQGAGASDLHLHPTPDGLEVAWRRDGVLHRVALVPARVAPNVVARLKVLADLLTYRSDVPQEGRIRSAPGVPEMRVSTFPTLHGERAVVRLFAASGRFESLDDLGLPVEIVGELRALLGETSGGIVLAGPAGSGKTTTLYACLRELVSREGGRRSLATMEDPIEVAVPGVAQAQVNSSAGLTLETGLKSLLRQDPEVLGVGEIRDRATAEMAVQASLTGHLVLTTFHAGSAAAALGRLADMGIEPYLLRSGVRAVLFQRLARRLCAACAVAVDPGDPGATLGLPVASARAPVGCAACGGTGYAGRVVLCELLHPDRGTLARAVLDRADLDRLDAAARADGMTSRWERAAAAVERGITSPAEVRRALGFDSEKVRGPIDGL
jgi:type II secretory ATPase GspE/PulE/Tfp pilus assembly ATPase PilB-like protein